MAGASWGATETPRQRERKAKVTPLPLSQMIPMTIVIMNESICGTMLMPFVGYFVAFLQKVPVNEAGYYSGILVGVFMMGQVLSAKTWGHISDKYGRRFPIISGLFTSGLMMLGFGLSTNVWMCASFRFFQGLFNGNVLVAKTMMADITDKTNQAGGFSFMSLCSAFGFLIGPGLGGLLYDPVNSARLQWIGFDKNGFFATHPAFLTSFVVFIYTNIGMLVCTFLVKESNPHARPLPGFVRYVYPCLWYKSEPFVLPPIQYETDDDEEDAQELTDVVHDERVCGSENASSDPVENSSNDTAEERYRRSVEGREGSRAMFFPRAMASTASDTTGMSPTYSPVEREEGNRDDGDGAPIQPATQRARAVAMPYKKASFTSPAKRLEAYGEEEDDVATETVVLVEMRRGAATAKVTEPMATSAQALSTRRGNDDAGEGEEAEVYVEEEEVVTVFGYREAFARPYTRFMLSQYMVLSATDMMARDCFPLWAVATTGAGGLGMSINQVSFLLLLNSAPLLLSNVLFRVVERQFVNRMGLMRLGVMGASIMVMLLPFNAYLGPSFWTYVLVFLCTAGRQVFVSWCYSLNTMLTARSAPKGHVGSIMGINQSCGALVRGIMPFIGAPLFAWSISGKHIFPFNSAMVFVISSLMFFWVWLRSFGIRTDADCNLQIVL